VGSSLFAIADRFIPAAPACPVNTKYFLSSFSSGFLLLVRLNEMHQAASAKATAGFPGFTVLRSP